MNCYYKDFSSTSAFKMTRMTQLAIIASLLIGGNAFADADEPPLFVEKSGVDAGNCQSAAEPCRTIGYALQRVGKNGQIRVGSGAFEVPEISDVVYMMSGAIEVKSNSDDSTLVGIPPEFAAEFGDNVTYTDSSTISYGKKPME